MKKTRENLEKMKSESLEAVYTHTHTSSFSERIKYFRKRKRPSLKYHWNYIWSI